MTRAVITGFEWFGRVLVEVVARVRVMRARKGCCGKDFRTRLGRIVSDRNGRALGGGDEMVWVEV